MKKYAWIVMVIASMGLVACKSNSSPRTQNQTLLCQEGAESLNIELEKSLERFERTHRRSDANRAASLCQEYFSMVSGATCISRDSLSGKEITLGTQEYAESCNRAAQYADQRKTNPRNPRSEAKALVDFEAGQLWIRITDGQALAEALRIPRRPMAFVGGRLVSFKKARRLAEQGEVACAVKAHRGRFIHSRDFPVTDIRNNARRQGQNVSLITKDGLEISCQSDRSEDLTPSSVKRAFGPVLEISLR